MIDSVLNVLKDIADVVAAFAAVLSVIVAIWLAYIRKYFDKKLANQQNGQLIFPIWQAFKNCSKINNEQPILLDVIQNINVLQLFAICWKNDLIDDHILFTMLGTDYRSMYEEIRSCDKIPGCSDNGIILLNKNNPINAVYNEINQRLNA